MPTHVAAMLGVPAAAEEPVPVAAADEAPRPSGTFSAPAVAVAVMAILGFGVIVGSVVSPPAESSQGAVIAVQEPAPTTPVQAPVTPPAKAAPAAAAPAAPVQRTVTQYVRAPTPTTPAAPAPVVPSGPQLPDVKHLFLVVLPPAKYDDAFGPDSKAPYLATDLRKQGELVPNYYAVTTSPLANRIALISGQGPNPDTLGGCTSYNDMNPGTESTDTQQKGQVLGTGCVFPRSTLTLPDELVANGRTWKAYVADPPPPAASRQDTTTTPTDTTTTTTDTTASPPPPQVCGRAPDTPFVSFHSVIDLPNCADTLAGIDQLTTDLSTAATTPTLAYIEPHLPDLTADDAFLKDLIPKITDSAAYKDGGMIAITFANSPQDGDTPDSSACCAEPVYPNIPAAPPADPAAPVTALPPGADTATGGGGRVGLLLLSSFVKPGTTAVSSYNHYSLLRSVEDLFGLQPTGYAGYLGVLAFDSVIYNAPATSS